MTNLTADELQLQLLELRHLLAREEARTRDLSARLAQISANILELTLQTTTDPAVWRLKADWNRPGDPVTVERRISLDSGALLEAELDPVAYGIVLGRAVFDENVRDLFQLARASAPILHVLLAVEDPSLHSIRWERLAGPVDDETWAFLRSSESTPFSLYVPSTTDRTFPPFSAEHFKVLVVVASPAPGNRLVEPFSEELAIQVAETGLGSRPWDLLCHVDHPRRLGPPSVGELCRHLAAGAYTGLHMVCHGIHRGEKSLIFLDADEALPGDQDSRAAAIPVDTLISRLSALSAGIPHFAFLSVCDSSAGGGAVAVAGQPWHSALRGLGQRMVRELGIKAVVAMTDRIGQSTALGLSKAFYPALLASGEADVALSRAFQVVWGREDSTTPTLYSRVVGRPLFTDSEAPLTDAELAAVRASLPALLKDRAPSVGDPSRLGLPELERLCEEVLELPLLAFARGKSPPPYFAECPFPGLRAFTASQKQFFCGRDALVNGLVERLRLQSVVCVLGNSGSGKSSVVAAGVIPILCTRNRQLRVSRITPGSSPEANLARAMNELEGAPAALLYVDQFEELFTLCRDRGVQDRFLHDLLAPVRAEYQVILTMRADFLGHCAPFPELRRAVQRQPELVPPMTAEELRGAIEAQARQAGLRYETGLLEDIFLELRREPGAMPLLQHALSRLWTHRRGRWLRRDDWHRQIGGVAGALQKTAEEVWEQLSEEDRALLPRLMTGLAQVGTGGAADTRRRAILAQLLPPRAGDETRQRVRALIETLAGEKARLLVTSPHPISGEVVVEVAHEALLTHWTRLRRWLDEARERLLMEQDLRGSAQAWVNARRQGDAWLEHRGVRLEAVKALLSGGMELSVEALVCRDDPALQGSVEDYVRACEAADLEAERRRSAEERRLRGALLGAAVRARLAAQDVLAVAALLSTVEDPADVPNFPELALKVLEHPMPLNRIFHGCPVMAAAWMGSRWITGDAEGEVRIWDLGSTGATEPRVVGQLSLHQPIREIRVQPGGDWVAIETSMVVRVARGVGTPEECQVVIFSGDPVATKWSPDGRRLLVAGNYRAQVFKAGTLEAGAEAIEASSRACEYEHPLVCAAISPDSQRFVLGDTDGTLHFWELESMEKVGTTSVGGEGYVDAVAWDKEGLVVANAGRLVWLDADGSQRGESREDDSFQGVTTLEFAHEGRVTLVGGREGWVRILHPVPEQKPWTPEPIASFDGPRLQLPLGITALQRGPDATFLSASQDGTVCSWPLRCFPEIVPRPRLPVLVELTGEEAPEGAVPSRDGHQLAYCDPEGHLRVRQVGGDLHHPATVRPLAFDPSGRYLIATGPDGTGILELPSLAWRAVDVPGSVRQVAWAADGGRVALLLEEGGIGTWDPRSGWQRLEGSSGELADPIFSPDGQWLATRGDKDPEGWCFCLWAWNLVAPTSPRRFERGGAAVHAVTFHPRAPTLVGTFDDFHAVGWDLESGDTLFAHVHRLGVIAAAYSPDGSRLATGCYDSAARVWSEDGRMQYLSGHQDHVFAVAWSANGRTLYAASRDQTVRGWDLETRTELLKVGVNFELSGLHVSEEELVVASAGGSSTARWPLKIGCKEVQALGLRLSAVERQKWLGV